MRALFQAVREKDSGVRRLRVLGFGFERARRQAARLNQAAVNVGLRFATF